MYKGQHTPGRDAKRPIEMITGLVPFSCKQIWLEFEVITLQWRKVDMVAVYKIRHGLDTQDRAILQIVTLYNFTFSDHNCDWQNGH